MKTEYEVRVLNIDVDKVVGILENIGAQKIGSYFQKRYVYDIVKGENDRFVRIRDNGEVVTITYKDKRVRTISGTKELEIEVNDFKKAKELLNNLGFTDGPYQENKRTIYKLEDAEFDFDTYPNIPTYLEIEGKDEETVNKYIKLLELENNEQTCDSIMKIYDRYGINITGKEDLIFEEE